MAPGPFQRSSHGGHLQAFQYDPLDGKGPHTERREAQPKLPKAMAFARMFESICFSTSIRIARGVSCHQRAGVIGLESVADAMAGSAASLSTRVCDMSVTLSQNPC